MSKRITILLVIAVLVLAALPLATAEQEPATPQTAYPWLTECNEDLSGQTVTFYHFGDLSGAYAFITQPIVAGFEDAIAMMNENGGLCGAEIVQQFDDTGGQQDQTQAFWDRYSSEEDAYSIFLYASADGELLRNQAAEAGIVLYNAAASELALYGEEGEPGWQYSLIPLYVDQLGAFCDYIAENWDAMEMDGDPVIGHLSWEGAFGRSSDTEETRAYCESVGIGYAGAEYFAPGTPDISTQLQSLVDEGANIIYTTSLASGPAQVAGAIATSESDVIMGGANWALDTSVIALGGQATNGIIGALPYLWWDDIDNPSVQLVTSIWQENRLAADPETALQLRNVAYLTAFGTVDLWAEAMIRAINEVGYDNLSGQAIKDQLDVMEYDVFGGVIQVDFTDGKRGVNQTRIGQIQFNEVDGNVVPAVVPLTDFAPVPSLWTGGEDVPE